MGYPEYLKGNLEFVENLISDCKTSYISQQMDDEMNFETVEQGHEYLGIVSHGSPKLAVIFIFGNSNKIENRGRKISMLLVEEVSLDHLIDGPYFCSIKQKTC